jgi:hypothetical protein
MAFVCRVAPGRVANPVILLRHVQNAASSLLALSAKHPKPPVENRIKEPKVPPWATNLWYIQAPARL